MTLNEIKPFVKGGKLGIIPKWKGYIRYDYYLKQLKFVDGDYIIPENELKEKIKDRTDLFYII